MALRKLLILRKLRSGCLEGRTALIQPIDNSFSAVLRSAAVHRASEFGDRLPRPFQADTLRRGRLFPKGDSGSALGDGANGTRRKPTTAIRTDIEQHLFDTLGAERALVAADPRIGRVGRQIPVAIFAVGPQLQHDCYCPSRAAAASTAARRRATNGALSSRTRASTAGGAVSGDPASNGGSGAYSI